MTIIYREGDGNIQALAGKTISIIGYGAIGRPAVYNLRDSGVQIIVGGDRPIQTQATDDGLPTDTIAGAVQKSQIVMVMLPDEVMPQTYITHISPYLTRQHTLIFSSAYNIASRYIEPPPFVDVGLIAPRTVGGKVRSRFDSDNQPFYSFVSVGADASGNAWTTVLALCEALGVLRGGALEINFEQEAELSQFVQQAVLPAMHHIMMTAAELLFQNGYPPEASFIDLYISGKFSEYMDTASKKGLLTTLESSTMTDQYGTFSRMERFNDLKLERIMEKVLEEIRNGNFAQEWTKEYADGHPRLDKLIKVYESRDIWDLEHQTLDVTADDGILPFDDID